MVLERDGAPAEELRQVREENARLAAQLAAARNAAPINNIAGQAAIAEPPMINRVAVTSILDRPASFMVC